MEDGFENTVSGLLRKRAALVGEVEALRMAMDAALSALATMDSAIRVFRPEIDQGDLPERPAPVASAAFRGEVQRFLLEALRKAGKPITTTELAAIVMDARRLNPADRTLAKLIRARTGHSLSGLRRKGFAESRKFGAGAELEWWLTGRTGEAGGWRNGSSTQ
jgi:hypothetical protein